MIVNAGKLAEIYSVDPRTVTNWVNSDPPCPSEVKGRERRFDTAAVARWREARAADKAVAGMRREDLEDIDEAKRRRAVADAQLAEIEVAQKEGRLVPVETLEATVAEMCDRLRAVAINAPSNYSIELEQAGVPAKDAQQALERIADDLIRSMRAAGDEMENDVEADD